MRNPHVVGPKFTDSEDAGDDVNCADGLGAFAPRSAGVLGIVFPTPSWSGCCSGTKPCGVRLAGND